MSNYKLIAYLLGIFSFVLFSLFTSLRYLKKRPLLSPFNISVYMYAFVIFFMPFMFFNNKAWVALGVNDYTEIESYLYKVLIINYVGFIIFTIFSYITEFSKKKVKVEKIIDKQSNKFLNKSINLLFWPIIVLWYMIVLAFNHGIPLLNGGRNFYMDLSISPIYLALNELIKLMALFYGVLYIRKRKYLGRFIIAVITLLFQGNRGPFLIDVCAVLALLYLYKPRVNKYGYIQEMNMKVKANRYFVFAITIIVLFIFGSVLSYVRGASNFDIMGVFEELLYGNTFSDIRDGAYILNGFENNFKASFTFGKTLLAGLLSFIPSSILEFRSDWSWGNFTTKMLFGWEGHGGLRGGNSLEGYINFGYLGVFIFQAISGMFNGAFNKWFHKSYIKSNNKTIEKEFIIATLLSNFGSLFICSAGFFNFYVDVVFVIGLVLISEILSLKKVPASRRQ